MSYMRAVLKKIIAEELSLRRFKKPSLVDLLFEEKGVEGEKLYHGHKKGHFPPRRRPSAGAIFLTSNLNFAKSFASFDDRESWPDGAVFEVKLKPGLKLCDPSDRQTMLELDLVSVIQEMIDDNYVDPNGRDFKKIRESILGKVYGYNPETDETFLINHIDDSVYHYLWFLKAGSWRIIETVPVIDRIKSKNFDGFFVEEGSNKNVAIFDENSIEKFEKIA